MGKTYAVSDIHGQWRLWCQIKNMLNEDDTLYIIGDCADRGKAGWAIIKEALADPRVIYIKGNHEDMLVNAMKHSYDKSLCYANGGEPTLSAWEQEGRDAEYIEKLNNLPVYKIYENAQGKTILMCHAGVTPWLMDNGEMGLNEDYDLVWNREHFHEKWDEEHYADVIVIHGHTPIPLMRSWRYGGFNDIPREEDWKGGIFTYCDGHKINIDNGCFFTNSIAVLDLDTMEEYIFTQEVTPDDCMW